MTYEVKLADRKKFLMVGINRTDLEVPLAMLEKGETLPEKDYKTFFNLLAEAVKLGCVHLRDTDEMEGLGEQE